MKAHLRPDPAVLLIAPGIIKWTDLDFGLPHLVSMGGYVQHHTGVRVELLDLNYEGGDHRQLARTLDELGPYLIIGISCFSSYDFMRTMALAAFVKELYPDVPLVTGGYHASALPTDLIYDGSPFDTAIVGEGELPLLGLVRQLLGGQAITRGIIGPNAIENLDDLPPYQWQLLARYWPRAHQIGRKFQIYLSRGCTYKCTFCMERAKTEYRWRAYSPERAIDELERLSKVTDLSRWVVNLADPLFGYKRSWRRQVLRGVIDKGLLPRQYWTLTRSDDLQDEDVELLAKARFSIGIGVESGSPEMLKIMRKTAVPDRYLSQLMQLGQLSRKHGLSWAGNVIVGHPGETQETMRQTHAFLKELFTTAKETCGWLSIDPFRLYPGAQVHEQMADWQREHGAVFHHPTWWQSWYDGALRAELVDPSHSLDFEGRVRFMYDHYEPLLGEVAKRFRGQGRDVDKVFLRSIENEQRQLSPRARDQLLARAKQARRQPTAPSGSPTSDKSGYLGHGPSPANLPLPIGLHVKDPWVRQREMAVRRVLAAGIVRGERLIEALLQVGPERFMAEDVAKAMLDDRPVWPEREGAAPQTVGVSTIAMALEALTPDGGERAADLCAVTGYVAALLAELVGPTGEVVAHHPGGWLSARSLSRQLTAWPQIRVIRGDPTLAIRGYAMDVGFLGAALPRLSTPQREALMAEQGRAVLALGPRFAKQDLVLVHGTADSCQEKPLARVRLPVLTGKAGWLRGQPQVG
ncbi:MAG: radical SAM protein [Myxococcales bacterium]|nr:radical SAM protein [Myxococcales bacterium]